MARHEIILGALPNGVGGDTPRAASMKINAMTQELFTALGAVDGALPGALPVTKGGTGRTSLGNAVAADLVTSRTDPTAGRVLTVGYSGLGATSNACDPDLNLIASTRMFFWGVWQTANIPSGSDYGEGIALLGSDASVMSMILVSHDSDRIWMRRKRANIWQPYVQIYTTANTTRAADGTLKAV